MKALRLEATGRLAVVEAEKPVPGPNDILVKVDACGICGTDRHLFHGEFPRRRPSSSDTNSPASSRRSVPA